MTKKAIVRSAFGFALGFALVFGFWYMFTVPMIDMESHPGDMKSVGGGLSHADVKYIDYRPSIQYRKAADVWWGTENGEWRRFELDNGFTTYTYTVAVLRDTKFKFSQVGVQRGDGRHRDLQYCYDKIRADYEQQSFFDRVWLWQVQSFR